MSKASRAVILAEDPLTQRFIYRYLSRLKQFKNPRYDIRNRIAPGAARTPIRQIIASIR